MKIWKNQFELSDLASRGDRTMTSHLGIEFTEIGEDYLVAKMPVDERTFQPMRIMHGGASCALAETVGSVAGNCCVDQQTHYCVGLDIHTSHIRMAKSGFVWGKAKPIHLGTTIQIWEIHINDDQHRLVSVTRLTLMVLVKHSKDEKG